ncbi:MAG: GNAT family N-acetyltransferase [Novosphingobium sp.]|nr:GNAT family N-acetyltransferase [Novosphingobium sp.]
MPARLMAAEGDQFERLLAGLPPTSGIDFPVSPIAEHTVLEMLAGLADTVRATFAPSAWWIICGRQLVGLLSITALRDSGVLQIGYGIAPSFRGQGHATAAVAELLRWAKGEPRVRTVYAETRTDNIASQRVLTRNGFVQTGQRLDDEDGEVLCWQADV